MSRFFQITSFLHIETTRTNSPLKMVAGGTFRGLKCKSSIIPRRICEQTEQEFTFVQRRRFCSQVPIVFSLLFIGERNLNRLMTSFGEGTQRNFHLCSGLFTPEGCRNLMASSLFGKHSNYKIRKVSQQIGVNCSRSLLNRLISKPAHVKN